MMRWSRSARAVALIVLVTLAIPHGLSAQSEQVRAIFHPTVDVGGDWFLVVWGIGNVRHAIPDNANLFAGFGRRGGGWWAEAMIWRQWSGAGDSWSLDFRFQKKIGNKGAVFVEASPFLGRRGLYDFVVVERRALERVSIGVETENVHKPGMDSLGAGPRLSRQFYKRGERLILSAVVAYQFRRSESDVLRLYLAVTARYGPK